MARFMHPVYLPRSCLAFSVYSFSSDALLEISRGGIGLLSGIPNAHLRRRVHAVHSSLQDFNISGIYAKEIVNALRLGDGNNASELLSMVVSGNGHVRLCDIVQILQYCVRSSDCVFAFEIWRKMEEKQINLSGSCYFLILKTLIKGGYLEEAFNMLLSVGGKSHINPTLPMYNFFLRSCIRMGSLAHANGCLDLMEQMSVGKNEITYSELLKFAVWQKNVSVAHEIWKEYVKYYNLSIISLRRFIGSFSKLKDIRSAYNVLQYTVLLAVKGCDVLDKTADIKSCSSRLDIPIPSNYGQAMSHYENGEAIIPVSSFFRNRKSVLKKNKIFCIKDLLRRSFDDVIHAATLTEGCEVVEKLVFQMSRIGIEPSVRTYDFFIRAVTSQRGYRDGLEILKIMKEKNLKPYDSSLATIAIACCRSTELELAEALLEQNFDSRNIEPFNAYFLACGLFDRPERTLPLLAKIKRLNFRFNIRTYEHLFSLFGNVNAPYESGTILSKGDVLKRIEFIQTIMEKSGIRHSYTSMKNLLKIFGAEGMTDDMIRYLCLAENQLCADGDYDGTELYNIVLHYLVEANESFRAVDLFLKMKHCGIRLDAGTYHIMLDCCRATDSLNCAYSIVSMVIRDGFHVTVVTYTSLVQILLSRENFNEALDLLFRGLQNDIIPDVLLFNTFFKAAREKERMDVVELCIQLMWENKIVPDPSTCAHVFGAYVDIGLDNMAVEALQVMCMWVISGTDPDPASFETKYNSSILSEHSETESHILDLFHCFEENLAFSLMCLRWCAMVGVPILWPPAHSLWSEVVIGEQFVKNKRP